jgi:hypothetical protein
MSFNFLLLFTALYHCFCYEFTSVHTEFNSKIHKNVGRNLAFNRARQPLIEK